MMVFLHSRYNSLFGLSSEEILEISQDINLKFTPSISTTSSRLTSKRAPKELLAISEEISREFSPSISVDTPQLVILPVDPEHLYAYWNVVENSAPNTPTTEDEPLTLRIYSNPSSKNREVANPVLWFDIAVQNTRMHQQVRLPMPNTETAYSATIGRRNPDNSFASFMHSNSIHVPRANRTASLNPEEFTIPQIMSQSMLLNREQLTYLCKPILSQGNNK